MKNCIVIILFANILAYSQPYLQWASTFTGPLADDKGNSIAVDNLCNSYVIGSSDAQNGLSDYLIIKYNSHGDTLWKRTYNGTGNGIDVATAIKVDKAGNVYVTGYSQGKNSGYDIVTIKYNTDGAMLGAPLIYNGPKNKDDIAYNIDIDLAGNIYVIGSSYVISSVYIDGVILKYSYDLNPNYLWMRNFPAVDGDNNFLNLINKKSNGNILVTDYGGSYDDFYRVIELNPIDGTTIITKNGANCSGFIVDITHIYNDGVVNNYNIHGMAVSLMVDYSDNVYVISSPPANPQFARIALYSGKSVDCQTFNIRYDIWADRHISSGNGLLGAVDAKIDLKSSRIYVLTKLQYSNSYFYLYCYDYGLHEIWPNPSRFDDNSNQNQYPITMSLVNDINNPGIILTGNNGAGDILLLRYDTSGNKTWDTVYDCGNFGLDAVSSMALDKYDNIYLTGYSDCDGNAKDVKTIKYCQKVPDAIITANGSSKICKGSNLTLSVSTCSGCTYHWSTNETNSSIVVTPSSDKSYKVTVTDTKCCDGVSAPFDVTIIDKPNTSNSSINGSTLICTGSSGNLFSITQVKDAVSYKWFPPSADWIGNSSTDSIIYKAGNSGGVLKVIAINACGSSDTIELPINIKNVPAQPTAISGETTVCSGLMKTYKIFTVPNANGYRWEITPNNSGWKSDNSNSKSTTLTSGSSSIKLKVYAINDCGESQPQELDINVTPLPSQPGNITGNNPVCAKTLNTYTISNIQNVIKYQWKAPGWFPDSLQTTSPSFTPQSSALQTTITVYGINECGDGPKSPEFTVTVNNVDASISKNNKTLTANANGATYQWLDCKDILNQTIIPGEIKKSFTPAMNGRYSVVVNQNNCIDTSTCEDIIVIGVDNSNFVDHFSVFPNPTLNNLNIVCHGYSTKSVHVYDNYGRLVITDNTIMPSDAIRTINFDKYPSGIYHLKIIGEGFLKTIRFLKI